MNTCGCTLAGTNACLRCPNSNINYYPSTTWYYPFHSPVITGKKITEKFDKDGKLIERITEDL
jgi:ABC-type uncharacterized transport system auxiliary subunit